MDMSEILSDENAAQRVGRGSRSFKMLMTLGLEPELLAIIASQTILNLMMLPIFRHKDEMQEAAKKNRFGEVPFSTAATAVGEALVAQIKGSYCELICALNGRRHSIEILTQESQKPSL